MLVTVVAVFITRGGVDMGYMEERQDRRAEMRRFFQQQKSVRPECKFGYQDCLSCKVSKNCKIKQFLG